MQFVPIEYRHKIVRQCFERLTAGGALIVVEKVLGNTAAIDAAFVETYYKLKAENQYSQEHIQNKRQALEGRLVPITAAWNEDLLRSSGFAEVDCIWRWCNFAAWLAVKR